MTKFPASFISVIIFKLFVVTAKLLLHKSYNTCDNAKFIMTEKAT